MWKTTGYIINLDKTEKDEAQKATSRGSVVINRKITEKQFNKISKILKMKD